jgi:DNA mismatch repair protein MutL
MGIIKVLPEIIANRIAAGEVVERPASIVKELVENSLDAGASRIEVAIRHGGKSLIRVFDDGCGMIPDDAEIAFQRHATSKIKDADDLSRIDSYGFRGEALPSIGAVSRTKLITRSRGASSGTEVSVEGGHLTGVSECPASEGTTVEVRDLFFNTPARRKFLKSDMTETGHVTDMVCNMALARPEIHFVFKSADQVVFDLPPARKLIERAGLILGEDTAKQLMEIEGEVQGVRIHGVIGKPRAARANRYGQSFFINRRWIRAIGLSYALQGGYHGLLMQDRYPVAVLFIDCDLSRVDVNVHPTKQEVRISNETQIKSFLKDLVEVRLRQEADLAPSMGASVSFGGQASATAPLPNSTSPGTPLICQTMFGRGLETVNPAPWGVEAAALEPVHGPILIKDKFEITKILGQVHHTFILAETREGLIIVDQHAAHERIQFESLLKGWAEGAPAKQNLLLEEVLTLEAKHVERMRDSLEFFSKTGFGIEEFGENTFVIRSVPSALAHENALAMLRRFLEEKEEGKIRTNLENRQEEIAALIACKKKSVKAHDAMTAEAMRSLLEQLSRCENPFNCPHGRPSFLAYSFPDLEKQFKRKL